MVEKTQTKFGLKIWVSHLYAHCPSPTPDILVLVKESSVHAFHQTVVLFASHQIDLSTAPFEPHSPTWILSTPIWAHIEAWALELLAKARKELCHVRLESLGVIIGMGTVSWFGKDLVGSMLCNWVLKVLFSIDGFMR